MRYGGTEETDLIAFIMRTGAAFPILGHAQRRIALREKVSVMECSVMRIDEPPRYTAAEFGQLNAAGGRRKL